MHQQKGITPYNHLNVKRIMKESLRLQNDFNKFFSNTPKITTYSRLRTLRRKYERMNAARVEEGMDALILPNLEATFQRFL